MTEARPPAGPAPWWRQPAVRKDLLVVTLVACAVYAIAGGHLALRSSIRYVESAREMVALNDWVVPQLNYVPYLEKPILTYWLAAAARWLFGPSMHATHLPSLLAGLLSLFCTFGLARGLRGGGFPLASTLFLGASAMFLVMTTELTTDPVLSGCLALAWLAWWRFDRTRQESPGAAGPWIWVFWAALGLGVLTKGLVAIVLPGMAIAGFAFLTGGVAGVFRTLWAMHPVRGTALLIAVNLPWMWLVWQRDPRFLEYFYVRFNIQAFYNDQVNHTGPWYLYLAVLPAAFFPWPLQTLAGLGIQGRDHLWPRLRQRLGDLLGRGPVSAVSSRRLLGGGGPSGPERNGGEAPVLTRAWGGEADPSGVAGTPAKLGKFFESEPDRLRLYLLCVVVFPLLFLSISTSKLGTYIMPLFPAVAVLVMDAVYQGRQPIRPPAWLRWPPLIIAGVLVLALVAAYPVLRSLDPVEAGRLDWSWWPVLVPAVLALVLGQVYAAMLMERRAILPSLIAGGLGSGLALALILAVAHDLVRDLTSVRVARLIAAHAGPRDPVVVDQELVHDYNFVYYLERQVATVGRARETGMGHFALVPDLRSQPIPPDPYQLKGETLPGAPGLWTWDRLVTTLASDQQVWLVGEDELIERLKKAGAKFTVIDQAMNVVVFTNHPGPDGGWPRR